MISAIPKKLYREKNPAIVPLSKSRKMLRHYLKLKKRRELPNIFYCKFYLAKAW